ncbi:MAG: divalent-cation tolerance protein CutA [Planctomycetota bacterium]
MLWMYLTTVADDEAARQLAGDLIANRLAACVQIDGPLRSVYRWNGDVHGETEFRLVIKTNEEHRQQLVAYLESNHPYEEPQIVGTPLNESSDGYAAWVAGCFE